MIFIAPQSRKELVLNKKTLVTTDGKKSYPIIKDVPILLPEKTNPDWASELLEIIFWEHPEEINEIFSEMEAGIIEDWNEIYVNHIKKIHGTKENIIKAFDSYKRRETSDWIVGDKSGNIRKKQLKDFKKFSKKRNGKKRIITKVKGTGVFWDRYRYFAEVVCKEKTDKILELATGAGGGTITFGYRIDEDKHYQLNPETAPVVLEVFQMYDSGVTMQQICDYLNEKGVKSVRGKNVDLNFVRGILHNPRYKGDYVYRDIVIPDGIPQIVSRELYDSVQNILEASKKAPARKTDENAYIFTTKLFYGTCKSYMVGESGTSCTGNKYHYYRCVNTKKKKICDAKHKSIRKDRLEEVVIGHIKKMLMDDEFVNYLATKAFELQEKESSELPLLRKQLEETEKGIENMLNAIQAGILNDSTKKRLDELKRQKSELETSIIKEEIRKPTYTFEQIYFYIISFRDVDTDTIEGRKTLVDHFVNSIVVYDDKILINLNYKKGSKQISFKEIENAGISSDPQSFLGAYLNRTLRMFMLSTVYAQMNPALLKKSGRVET